MQIVLCKCTDNLQITMCFKIFRFFLYKTELLFKKKKIHYIAHTKIFFIYIRYLKYNLKIRLPNLFYSFMCFKRSDKQYN